MAIVDPPWFVRKRIGWGLSPGTWQGWAAIGILANAVLICAIVLAHDAVALGIAVGLLLVAFCVVAVLTGEAPGKRARRR